MRTLNRFSAFSSKFYELCSILYLCKFHTQKYPVTFYFVAISISEDFKVHFQLWRIFLHSVVQQLFSLPDATGALSPLQKDFGEEGLQIHNLFGHNKALRQRFHTKYQWFNTFLLCTETIIYEFSFSYFLPLNFFPSLYKKLSYEFFFCRTYIKPKFDERENIRPWIQNGKKYKQRKICTRKKIMQCKG